MQIYEQWKAVKHVLYDFIEKFLKMIDRMIEVGASTLKLYKLKLVWATIFFTGQVFANAQNIHIAILQTVLVYYYIIFVWKSGNLHTISSKRELKERKNWTAFYFVSW